MVHNAKKRTVSESEAVKKVKEEFVSKKKKSANGAPQNGQANKEVKKEVLPQVKVEQKPGGDKKTKESRMAYREKRKQARAAKGAKPDISVEDIKKKVEEIEKRGNLSKSAKRKLAALKKLLSVKEGTYKPKPQVVKKQAGEGKKEKQVAAANKKQVQNTAEQKKKVPEKVEAKSSKDSKKKDIKQGNLLLVKQENQPELDPAYLDSSDSELEEHSSSNGEGDDFDFWYRKMNKGDDDDDDNDDDDDDDEDSPTDLETLGSDTEEDAEEVKTKDAQSEPKQAPEQGGKKKRYVLFVGNLPFNVTPEEIKKHFLTKVSQIVDIRIPKSKDNAPRGFAYVELGNHTDYEKAIALNNSFVNGRRINVQYSGSNKKETVAKNQKLQALHKAGKLGGGQKTNFRKNPGSKGGKPNAQKTKT
ncbi:uncharacterized protein LOC143208991 [Lasioglossum baleicum]|uniref:uncharacterized protein LOC143208991 n=1 Tax=Lasioglossum baleicum TaxID=434251 RepID=UPI003FCE673B